MENTISHYNTQLNASYSMENKFRAWSGYRENLRKICLQQGPWEGDIAIFGAGHLNDIDLQSLPTESVRLTLFDCDAMAIKKGLALQGYQGEVIKRIGDLTGLDQARFFTSLTVLMAEKDVVGVERFLDEWVCQGPDLQSEGTFDLILISPLYTQLLWPQFLDLVVLMDLQAYRSQLTEAMLRFLVRLIETLHRSILKTLKPEGRCMAWSDIMEYSTQDPRYLFLSHKKEDLKKHVLDYEKQYGQGLGSYGLWHLETCLDKTHPIEENWLIWPFDKDRHLITKVIQGIR